MRGRRWARRAGVAAVALTLVLAAAGQQAPPAMTVAQVLAALDQAAPRIRSVSAQAQVDDYTALVADTATSHGQLAFKRGDGQAMYALDLNQPPATARKLVYRHQTAYVYTPSAHQVMVYPLEQQQAMVNQFLLLGMGATGAELARSYTIALLPDGAVGGTPAVHLRLTPRDPKLAAKLTQLDLWYDPRTWVAVEQQMWQPGGDYHRLTLSAVKVNPKLSDKLFSTSFPGATVVRPGH